MIEGDALFEANARNMAVLFGSILVSLSTAITKTHAALNMQYTAEGPRPRSGHMFLTCVKNSNMHVCHHDTTYLSQADM